MVHAFYALISMLPALGASWGEEACGIMSSKAAMDCASTPIALSSTRVETAELSICMFCCIADDNTSIAKPPEMNGSLCVAHKIIL